MKSNIRQFIEKWIEMPPGHETVYEHLEYDRIEKLLLEAIEKDRDDKNFEDYFKKVDDHYSGTKLPSTPLTGCTKEEIPMQKRYSILQNQEQQIGYTLGWADAIEWKDAKPNPSPDPSQAQPVTEEEINEIVERVENAHDANDKYYVEEGVHATIEWLQSRLPKQQEEEFDINHTKIGPTGIVESGQDEEHLTRYLKGMKEVNAPTILTQDQKLDALAFKHYQGAKWEPKTGDYYTTSRNDLELYQIVEADEKLVKTKYCDPARSGNISEWPTERFLLDFGLNRVWVPDWILKSKPNPSPDPSQAQPSRPESNEGGETFGGKEVTVLDLVEEKRVLQGRIMELTDKLNKSCDDWHELNTKYLALKEQAQPVTEEDACKEAQRIGLTHKLEQSNFYLGAKWASSRLPKQQEEKGVGYSEQDMKDFATRCVLYYGHPHHNHTKTVHDHLREYNEAVPRESKQALVKKEE